MKSRNLNSSNIIFPIPIACTARMSVSTFLIQMDRRQNHFAWLWNEGFQWNTEQQLTCAKLWNWRGGCPLNLPPGDLEGIVCSLSPLFPLHLSLLASPPSPFPLFLPPFSPPICTILACPFHHRYLNGFSNLLPDWSLIKSISMSLLESQVSSFRVTWFQWTPFPVVCLSEAPRKMRIHY